MTSRPAAFKTMMPDWLVLSVRYRRRFGRFPNFLRPRTFNEKIIRRIILSRDTRLALFADKYKIREYVAARLGPAVLPALLYVTTKPASIPLADLPNRFVVKPSHGSGWVQVVPDKAKLDEHALVQTCERWLALNYYDVTKERAYREVEPRIMIEELIDDGTGLAPADYKFHVFNGRVELILLIMGRLSNKSHSFLDRSWQLVDVSVQSIPKMLTQPPPPPHLAEMIKAAELLGRDIDFVRVDFYDTADRFVFGEMTSTPGSGMDPFVPDSFDISLGKFWRPMPASWKEGVPAVQGNEAVS